MLSLLWFYTWSKIFSANLFFALLTEYQDSVLRGEERETPTNPPIYNPELRLRGKSTPTHVELGYSLLRLVSPKQAKPSMPVHEYWIGSKFDWLCFGAYGVVIGWVTELPCRKQLTTEATYFEIVLKNQQILKLICKYIYL